MSEDDGRCFAMADVGGVGALTRRSMRGFELVDPVDFQGEYVFRHPDPDNDVTITVRTDSIGFLKMTRRKDFDVILIFTNKDEPMSPKGGDS